MIDRVYYRELECYQNMDQTGHKYDEKTAYYDLSILPTDTMREEFRRFLINEGTRVKIETIQQGKTFYKQLVSILNIAKKKPSSFLSWSEERWIQMAKMWMMQNGVAFYESKITVYGTQGYREVQGELTSLRRFSKYLRESKHEIQSCSEIDRELLEEYLVHISTDGSSGKSNSNSVLNLRKVLETVGKIFDYEHLERLFINTDIPPEVQPKFTAYSDSELKRVNAHITKLDVQITRCLVIHQMLGTRISDTLTLKKDCLKQQNGLDIIRIDQVKTRTFEKPISTELAALIKKAIACSNERYGETEYIFVDEKDTSRPLQYGTIKSKVLHLIFQEDLKDDNSRLFKFSTHMFRRSYGVKLTELHLDDWTIAKLLGHSNINSVKHYRKMSNQILADETRRAREMQTRILLENLDGWGEDYEQIRKDG